MKRSKYGNIKTICDGIKFDSASEATRYRELQLLLRAGEITDLKLQPVFHLVDGVKFHDEPRRKPNLIYKADFSYTDKSGAYVVEDVKGGPVTDAFRIKRHLMKALNGIDITIVRKR